MKSEERNGEVILCYNNSDMKFYTCTDLFFLTCSKKGFSIQAENSSEQPVYKSLSKKIHVFFSYSFSKWPAARNLLLLFQSNCLPEAWDFASPFSRVVVRRTGHPLRLPCFLLLDSLEQFVGLNMTWEKGSRKVFGQDHGFEEETCLLLNRNLHWSLILFLTPAYLEDLTGYFHKDLW